MNILATLMRLLGADGTPIGQCDARCYNARLTGCDCICGGENHGVGINVAIANTENNSTAWVLAAVKRLGLIRSVLFPKRKDDAPDVAEQLSLMEAL